MSTRNRKHRSVRKSKKVADVIVARGISFSFSVKLPNGRIKKVRVSGLYSGNTYRTLKAAHNSGDLVLLGMSAF